MTKKLLVVTALLALVALPVLAATNLSFKNSTTLQPGTYCHKHTFVVEGRKVTSTTTIKDGACTDGGDTIVIPAPVVAAAVVVTPEVPAECSHITFNGVTKVNNTYGTNVVGTSLNDYLVSNAGGSRVDGLGGDDCIVIVENSTANGGAGNDVILHSGNGGLGNGNGGDDFIRVGNQSGANGGAGTDTCEIGAQSGAQNCEL